MTKLLEVLFHAAFPPSLDASPFLQKSTAQLPPPRLIFSTSILSEFIVWTGYPASRFVYSHGCLTLYHEKARIFFGLLVTLDLA